MDEPRILICSPYRASTPPALVERWQANADALGLPRLLMRDDGAALPNDTRYAAHARARNRLLDQIDLGAYDYLYWVDIDVVTWPDGLLAWALENNPDGISAPAVTLEGHGDRFFDVWGFLEGGRPARPYPPWFDQAGPVVDLDSVGCCYIAPTDLYRDQTLPGESNEIYTSQRWFKAARYQDTPGERTEHFPIMQAARNQGRRVRANLDCRAVHAFPAARASRKDARPPMRVLVGLLAHELNSETVRRVHTLEWGESDGYDVLTCWGGDMRPDENRFQAITRKYQALQRIFLGGPWDCLLTVEQDMLIPPDTLTKLGRLIADGAHVAYGLYVWRYQEQHWWSAHPKIANDDQNVPWFWSLTQFPEDARRLWGQPVLVDGLGLGCTLISRHALTRIPFRQGNADHCNDTTFALDCKDEGLIQICDLGVVCGHRIDPEHTIWPDIDHPTLYRIDKET